jgi:hypothetical protein
MSNNYQNWDEEDFDIEDETEQPRKANDGNDLVKQLRKSLRDAEKRNKELETAVSEYNTQKRQQTIQSVLAERGVNPAIAEFIPSDIDSTDVEALNNWLDSKGEIFGIQQRERSQDINDLNRINSVTENSGTFDNSEQMFSSIDGAKSEEELYAILRSLG